MADAKPKELRITFPVDSKQPTYAFTGAWTGHEVSSIVRGLTRAYRLYTRGLRRAKVPSEPETVSVKGEVK